MHLTTLIYKNGTQQVHPLSMLLFAWPLQRLIKELHEKFPVLALNAWCADDRTPIAPRPFASTVLQILRDHGKPSGFYLTMQKNEGSVASSTLVYTFCSFIYGIMGQLIYDDK